MREVLSLRQNVSEPVHRVLDCLEEIFEGPLGRVTPEVLLAEIDLIGDTVFGIALEKVPGPESDADMAERLGEQAVRAVRHPQAVRMAALLLLAIERGAEPVDMSGGDLADILPVFG